MPWLGNSYIRVGVRLLVLCRHRHLFRIEFAELGGVFVKDSEAMAEWATTRRFRVRLRVRKFALVQYRCI
jgi:hypothetical protein